MNRRFLLKRNRNGPSPRLTSRRQGAFATARFVVVHQAAGREKRQPAPLTVLLQKWRTGPNRRRYALWDIRYIPSAYYVLSVPGCTLRTPFLTQCGPMAFRSFVPSVVRHATPFRPLVALVVTVRSEAQMVAFVACWGVAAMNNDESWRYGTFGEMPNQAMQSPGFSLKVDSSVSGCELRSRPEQAPAQLAFAHRDEAFERMWFHGSSLHQLREEGCSQ